MSERKNSTDEDRAADDSAARNNPFAHPLRDSLEDVVIKAATGLDLAPVSPDQTAFYVANALLCHPEGRRLLADLATTFPPS